MNKREWKRLFATPYFIIQSLDAFFWGGMEISGKISLFLLTEPSGFNKIFIAAEIFIPFSLSG
jgi:hypothetical protein